MLLQSERGTWRSKAPVGGLRHRPAATTNATAKDVTNVNASSPHVQSGWSESTSSTGSETNSDDEVANIDLCQKQATVTKSSYSNDDVSSTTPRDSAISKSSIKIDTQKDIARDTAIIYEFGGPVGVALLMIGFPVLMSYLFICLGSHAGHLKNPFDMEFWSDGLRTIFPSWRAIKIYLGFNAFQYVTAASLPGVKVLGLPVPSLGGKQLEYLCNGVATWYVDLILIFVLHEGGYFPITSVVDEIGPIMSVAMIWGVIVTLATYVVGVVSGKTHRMSGSILYDIFMGAVLNPRIGNVDLKMWSEIRIPWKLLFFISLSAAVKDHEINVARSVDAGIPTQVWHLFGGLLEMNAIQTSPPLLFMTLAHFLYVNACMKGEECIPTTWDIFYEKWGYMLIFWNFAGVPFSYCYSSLYLLNRSLDNNPIDHSTVYIISLFIILMAAYYVWDTANSQKNRFRMQQRGTYIKRNTFPQLPWGTLHNPTFVQTKHGNKLLTGGWWGIARKIHYTADLVMALSWGLITGFDSFIPYFYVCFFTVVLVHRVGRDHIHCKEKYGVDFEEYCRQVPYIFIPFVF